MKIMSVTRSRRRKGDDEKGLRCERLQRGQSEFAPGFHSLLPSVVQRERESFIFQAAGINYTYFKHT